MKTKLYLSLAIVLITLSGCSNNPSERDMKMVIRGRIEQQSEGRIKLVKAEKINGVLHKGFGANIYVMDYRLELEFLDDCYWGPFQFDEWSGNFRTAKESFFGAGKKARKGERQTISDQMSWIKTEQGWQLQ